MRSEARFAVLRKKDRRETRILRSMSDILRKYQRFSDK